MIKVGILYICTGNYITFWKEFHKTIMSYFLPDVEKHFFVWTDSVLEPRNNNVHVYFQKVEKWPFPTLNRFAYFMNAYQKLSDMDYLVFMNANLYVNKKIIANDILPLKSQKLFATLHPGFYSKAPNQYTYENNPQSCAYIGKGKGKFYFAGGFYGGRTPDFLNMINCLRQSICTDLENDIIAIWHDESHLNRYLIDYGYKNVKILSPSYLYPEGWRLPFERRILILDKNKYGGHDFLRGNKKS